MIVAGGGCGADGVDWDEIKGKNSSNNN